MWSRKNVVDVFLIKIPNWMQSDFETQESEAKARFTEFYAKKEDQTPVVYGIVLEIYSPDFKDPQAGINDIDKNQVNPLTGTLQSVGVPTDEIWEHLDRAAEDNEWGDLRDRYQQAEKLTQPILEALHTKVQSYLTQRII
jgi:hypothetical protein